MNPPTPKRAPRVKRLEQQNADFTSEGSPPPGMVAKTTPATGEGGEGENAKQRVLGAARATELDHLTTNQGLRIADNHNSLKAGARGPTLLEDFILREKITHFDHERIPERAVHARGAGAHGFFEVYEPMTELTCAGFLADPAVKTPVFVRFSTVAGSRGSADTVRDVRGFAVKFYTREGNYDLVGNNMPVFFIQDAIKFPDLVHAVKAEPHNEIPQAASAHDTFWDFATLMPETTHMLMWAMSDRALPRSYRMMEGFGVHSFRLVNAAGISHFVKFHWKPKLGIHGLAWDEAQKLAGKDADFHRRDLWEAIDAGNFPEWEFGIQVVPEADQHKFDFDLLDPTKLIPEELVPVRRIGRMVLNRNPDNFFAETEQVAFHPGHLVPGIDFSNDPLLQGRLFSYTDTQLSRLGGPNFHELPINQGVCPFHNFQRDGNHRQMIGTGRVAYEPNTLASGKEFRVDGALTNPLGACRAWDVESENWPQRGQFLPDLLAYSPAMGQKDGEKWTAAADLQPTFPKSDRLLAFTSFPELLEPPKLRVRSASFNDHYAQARMFWISQSVPEQDHIVSAFQFELSKLETPAIRQRMVANLAHVDAKLAALVAAPLGIGAPDAKAAAARPGFRTAPAVVVVKASAALSMAGSVNGDIATRRIAMLVADGVDGVALGSVRQALESAGASCKVLAAGLGTVATADGGCLAVDARLVTTPSITFDAVYLPPLAAGGASALAGNGDAVHFVLEAYKHCKAIAASGSGAGLLSSLGLPAPKADGVSEPRAGVVLSGPDASQAALIAAFIAAIGKHRHWERSQLAAVPA